MEWVNTICRGSINHRVLLIRALQSNMYIRVSVIGEFAECEGIITFLILCSLCGFDAWNPLMDIVTILSITTSQNKSLDSRVLKCVSQKTICVIAKTILLLYCSFWMIGSSFCSYKLQSCCTLRHVQYEFKLIRVAHMNRFERAQPFPLSNTRISSTRRFCNNSDFSKLNAYGR